jgi:hypothetical protein
MNVLQTYRSLSAEQKQILKAKQVDESRPVDEWLTLFKPLAASDAAMDKARKPLGCTFALSIVLGVISLFVFGNNGWGPAGYVAIGVIVAVLIGSSSLYFWTRGADLSNNMREFIVPVLTVFREDIDPARPVHLKLDLRSPTCKAKKTAVSAPYKKGAYHKIVDTTYTDEWMTARAFLVDGTRLSWQVTDTIRERQKTKRNARGKYKSKTKYSKKSELEVELALRKKTYDIGNVRAAEVTQDEKKNTVRVETKVRSATLDAVAPRALIDLVVSVYAKAKPAKEARA